MNYDDIWIAITCYNKERFIFDAIKSALDETDRVVVVDDCSDDSSGEIIRSFNLANFIQNASNCGSSYSTKVAIERAASQGAKFVVLLDGDDVLAPGSIQQFNLVIEDCGADAVYTRAVRSASEDLRGASRPLTKLMKYEIVNDSFQHWLDSPRAGTCVGAAPDVLLEDLHPLAPVQDNQIGLSVHRNARRLAYSIAETHFCSVAVKGENLALDKRALAESWVVMYCAHYDKVVGRRGFSTFEKKSVTSAIRLRYLGNLDFPLRLLFSLLVPLKAFLPATIKKWVVFKAGRSLGLVKKPPL